MRWHLNTIAAVMVTAFTMSASAQMPEPKPEHEAEALLLLNMASKEARAAKLVTTAKGCIESKDVAERIARDRGRPVVYWVGMHCDEAPAVRAKLADAVNCHVPTWNDDPTPRVVIEARIDGGSLFSRGDFLGFKKKDLAPAAAPEIRRILNLPEQPKR